MNTDMTLLMDLDILGKHEGDSNCVNFYVWE